MERAEREIKARKESVGVWAETLGITSSKILKNKEFIKAYHSSGGKTSDKVDKAMKIYLKDNPIQSAEKKLATLKLSTTGTSNAANKKSVSLDDIDSLLDGKSLEEIDLSQL